MGKYKIAISDRAKKHLAEWEKSGKVSAIKKIERIFKELSENPFEGVGAPEQLKFNFANCWSRRINRKDRIIYQHQIISQLDTRYLILVLDKLLTPNYSLLMTNNYPPAASRAIHCSR